MNKNKEDMAIEIPQMDFGEIETIVNTGVRSKVSFLRYLKRCYRELGFKNIFHDKNELIVIGIIGIIMMVISMVNFTHTDIPSLYKLTFIISPILYLCVVLFSFYNSKEKGAFEIEMTCKYNLYQLASLRMFSFSIVSILINTASIVVVEVVFKQVDMIRMIVISITGLFLFSTVFLYSLMKFTGYYSKYFVIGAWFVINLVLSSVDSAVYLQFLMKAPLVIHFLITILCIFLYVHNLKKLINYRRKKGEI